MVRRRRTNSNTQHPTRCSQPKFWTNPSIQGRTYDFDPLKNELGGKISTQIGLHIQVQRSGHAEAVADKFLLNTEPITKL